MKILHVIPSIAPVYGGPSQAIIEMIEALHSNGVDAEIATTNNGGKELLDVTTGKCIDYKSVPVWFFPCFFPKSQAMRQFVFSTKFKSWLEQNITNYDLIHIHALFNHASTTAMKVAKSKKIPYVVRPLGQLCQWSLNKGNIKKKIYLEMFDRANLNRSKALHFTSKQEREEVSRLNLKMNSFILPHGLTIPNCIPEAHSKLRAKLQLSADEQIILFLSRIHPKKGLDYLIPALSKIKDKPFTFILAGNADFNYETEIDHLLRKHDISSRTIRTGFVEGEYKNLLLQGSDIFALTSYSENFGVAVLEALAAGTAVLTTPGVALTSLLERENIGYVTELNINEIVSNLEHILSHPKEAKEKGDRASIFVKENYTWNLISLKMIDLYKKVISN